MSMARNNGTEATSLFVKANIIEGNYLSARLLGTSRTSMHAMQVLTMINWE